MKHKNSHIRHMVVHHVGNKSNGEGVGFSSQETSFSGIESELLKVIDHSFNLNDLYHFYYEGTVELNPIYAFIRAIFINPEDIVPQSNHIAKILYENSVHPKIKAGELSVIHLSDVELEGEDVDAIVLIKSETRQSVLQLDRTQDGFEVRMNDSMNLSKIEKGCIIFNTEQADGYRLAIVDNSSASGDAKYWKDSFLHISSCNGAHHQTSSLVGLATAFIAEDIAVDKAIPPVEKAMIANRSKQVLTESEADTISFDDYARTVFRDKKIEQRFAQYAEDSGLSDLAGSEAISIERKAINRRRLRVTTIHLDGNFDVLVKGGEERILRGYDENAGMNYYMFYFEEEC